jgi:hypothetical protein
MQSLRYWESIANDQFAALDPATQHDWNDLRKKTR